MNTRDTLDLLRTYESRNVLFIDPDGTWPIVWKRASGVHVWDAEGRQYLDLTAAFGVAASGHANARVVDAARRQLGELVHAMGDVHPHERKAELARLLSQISFERWTASSKPAHGKTIFCNSGFEAVEAALKTAMLATGRHGVIAFHGGYHGLGYGALNTTHREHFRSPFRMQLKEFAQSVPFPSRQADLAVMELQIRRGFQRGWIGAILVEPVQARGGIHVPPAGFLKLLRKLCDEHKALLILDEIYTGFGRTGKLFACEHEDVIPDLICLGKAMTGGFPLSACVGKAEIMDAAWPPSSGEAIHTSTFLGHPVGCAMALAQIAEIQGKDLVERSAELGTFLQQELDGMLPMNGLQMQVRGSGLMVGLELTAQGKPAGQAAVGVIKAMLQRGYILLPEGEHGNVISFTPPLTITRAQLAETVAVLGGVLNET